MSSEAMKLALEALEKAEDLYMTGLINAPDDLLLSVPKKRTEAITALREALAEQPAQDDPDLQDKDPELVEQPAQQCKWPTCQSEEYQQALAEQIKRELVGEQPAQQEPVAWRNAALRVGEDLCSVGPFGYYDMTAEQWLDWALSVVTVHAPPRTQPPAQRKPLTDEQINKAAEDEDNETAFLVGFYAGARFAEATHGITGEQA